MKISRPFELKISLEKDGKYLLEPTANHKAWLYIDGIAYMNTNYSNLDAFLRYSVDIDFVYYEGTNIRDVLEATGVLDDLEELAVMQASELFNKVAA